VAGLGDVAATRRVFDTPLAAVAYTVKAKATADAIHGVPGSLRTARVVRAPG
jgi:hypothetical protein